MEDLDKAFREAYSLENVKGHEVEINHLKLIGIKEMGKRKFRIYEDQDKRFWYETEIQKDGHWYQEEVAIFGRKINKFERRHL